MKIAIIGPFVIENYGDHLIRDILVHKISSAVPTVNLVTYDVFGGPLGFRTDETVFSIDDLEAHHLKEPFDALVVAGGSVIHFETLMQKINNDDKEAYAIWKLWAHASRVASRYGINLLWNNPEIPIDFIGWQKIVAKSFINSVDFLSVRDSDSLRVLSSLGFDQARQSPDSGWLIDSTYEYKELLNYHIPELDNTTKIAVFHCNHRLAEQDMAQVIDTLMKLKNKGFAVVLLPLAYTNAEEVLLEKLNNEADDQFIVVKRRLSVAEMAAFFARCNIYIGLSFHGAITTASFGGEVIAFDYEIRRKTKNLYTSMKKSKNYTTDAKSLDTVIDRFLLLPSDKKTPDESILELKNKTAKHFEAFIEELLTLHGKQPLNIDEYFDVAITETQEKFKYLQQIRELSDGYSQCYQQYQELLNSKNNVS